MVHCHTCDGVAQGNGVICGTKGIRAESSSTDETITYELNQLITVTLPVGWSTHHLKPMCRDCAGKE